jgi:glutathione S-transferase
MRPPHPGFYEPSVPQAPPSRRSVAFVPDEVLLYDLSDSAFCLKARICLQVKGVPFRRVTVTLGRRGELRRLNPLGRVPVLVHGETVIADQSRIAHHLDEVQPEPRLVPIGAEARAYAGLVEAWADGLLAPIVSACKWLNPDNRAAALANTVTEMAGAPLRPLVGWLLVRLMQRRHAARGYTPYALDQVEDRLQESLARVATLLDGKLYLLGRTPTLADVAVFAQLACLRRYAEARLVDQVAAVGEWLERLGALPPIAAALAS